MLWVWAVLLLAVGLGLVVMEIFFPSAGILALFSAATLLAAIILGFQHSLSVGLAIAAVAVAGVPTVVILGFRYWPRTAMGRRLMLNVPRGEDVLPDNDERRFFKGLVGRTGRAKCKMLPGGMVLIDGRTVDAVSEGVCIEAGARVRVIQVRGTRVVVRLAEDEAPAADAEDPLRRPIDLLTPDPFDDRGA